MQALGSDALVSNTYMSIGTKSRDENQKFHICWSHSDLRAAVGKGAAQKCPLLPMATAFCHQTWYMSITQHGFQVCPIMGLIVQVRAMLALRIKKIVRRKGRGKQCKHLIVKYRQILKFIWKTASLISFSCR